MDTESSLYLSFLWIYLWVISSQGIFLLLKLVFHEEFFYKLNYNLVGIIYLLFHLISIIFCLNTSINTRSGEIIKKRKQIF